MADPSVPVGRLVAARATGSGLVRAETCRLEPGPLAVSLEVEGVPIGDLPAGTRLRIGPAAVVELGPAAAGDGPAGVLESGTGCVRPGDVLEGGSVEAGDPVSLEAVALLVADVLDLHSFRPADVPAVVAEYVEAARRAGLAEVRIVHGRGRGVQRAVVRRLLAGTTGVAGFAEAPPARGGWGATIVRLLPGEEPVPG